MGADRPVLNGAALNERASGKRSLDEGVESIVSRRIAVTAMDTGEAVSSVLIRLLRKGDYDRGDGSIVEPDGVARIRELAGERVTIWGRSMLSESDAERAGDLNDSVSEKGAGVSLLLVGELTETARSVRIPGASYSKAGDGFVRVNISDGSYCVKDGSMHIYSASHGDFDGHLDLRDVVRAQGYKGEVWQNPDKNWDGPNRKELRGGAGYGPECPVELHP